MQGNVFWCFAIVFPFVGGKQTKCAHIIKYTRMYHVTKVKFDVNLVLKKDEKMADRLHQLSVFFGKYSAYF